MTKKNRKLIATAYTQSKEINSFTECHLHPKKVFVIFIGGAGDQESYYGSGPYFNINNAKDELKKTALFGMRIKVVGYNKIYNESDINTLVNMIHKDELVYIIGHSLGGWNGAHLSKKLFNKGYNVRMLITLDPVGEGNIVKVFSKIYSTPELDPKAKIWINVVANPQHRDSSDSVANFGEKWVIPESRLSINGEVNATHANARALFIYKLETDKSALDYLIEDVNKEMAC